MSESRLFKLGSVPAYWRHTVSARVYPRAAFVGAAAAIALCVGLVLLEPATNSVELVFLGYFVLHSTYVVVWFWWGGEAWDLAQEAMPNQESWLERRVRYVLSGWVVILGATAIAQLLPGVGVGVNLISNLVLVLWLNRIWLRRRQKNKARPSARTASSSWMT